MAGSHDGGRWDVHWSQRALAGFLRTIGVVDLAAFLAMVLPRAAMSAIHEALGLGPLPAEPIVGYLARSASMFYGLTGALLIWLGSDVVRHRPLIRFVGRCGLLAGAILLMIDLAEGLPTWWIAAEGPGCLLLSAAALGLQTLQERSSPAAEADRDAGAADDLCGVGTPGASSIRES